MRTLACAVGLVMFLLLGGGDAGAVEEEILPKEVVLRTDDGLKLAALWWDEPTPGSPAVILLHAAGSDRYAFKPLITALRIRGIEVISMDLRGHRGSAKQGSVDMGKRAQALDPKLFADMHIDALAAMRYLVKTGLCDPKRIALCGADSGASVAIDTACRHPGEIAAVVCLTPSQNLVGMDSVAMAKAFPAGEPVLFLSHRSEAAGSEVLHDAIPGSRLVVYDVARPKLVTDEQWVHGTKMLGRLPLVEQTIASFLAAKTGSTKDDVVLDGIVDERGKDGDPWAHATIVAGKGVEAWAYRIGRRVEFAGRVRGSAVAVRMCLMANFAPGVFPDYGGVAGMGWPEMGVIDAATGTWTWVEPHDLVKANRGRQLATQTRPRVRAVRTEDGFTFEGEWICDYGASAGVSYEPVKVRVAFQSFDETPPHPEEAQPGVLKMDVGWVKGAVEVEPR